MNNDFKEKMGMPVPGDDVLIRMCHDNCSLNEAMDDFLWSSHEHLNKIQ